MTKQIPFYTPPPVTIDGQFFHNASNSAIELLEAKSKKTFDANFAVAVSNGANAMHLALCALDIKRGDKIICSVNSFASTPQAIRHFDAEPIFVDCDSKSYMIDIEKLEATLEVNQNKKLRAIIINSMDGGLPDMQTIKELSKKYDVKVILDATDAMGSKHKNNALGALGLDMVIFSFAPNIHRDIISGGILIVENETIYNRAIMLRSNGIANQLERSASQANYAYDIVDIGCDYMINELSALACIGRLENIDSQIKRKKEIANLYKNGLTEVSHVSIVTDANQDNITQFFIEIDKNRDHFARELMAEGVEIALHYVPLHLSEYYRNKYSLKVFDFPVALGVYQKTMSLPIYATMSEDDVQRVITAIKNVALQHMK